MSLSTSPASTLTFRHSAPATVSVLTASKNTDIWSLSAQSDITVVDNNTILSNDSHDTFNTASDVTEADPHPDTRAVSPSQLKRVSSIYYSLKSRFSITSSLYTTSTGRHSCNGATWPQSMSLTLNSGFGSGAPRSLPYSGAREGREKELGRGMKGVGRTGKGPLMVPRALARAMALASGNMLRNGVEVIEEIEGADPYMELEGLKRRVVRMKIQLSYVKEGVEEGREAGLEERFNELVLRVNCLGRDLEVDEVLSGPLSPRLQYSWEQHKRQLCGLEKEADRLEDDLRRLDEDVNGPGKTFHAMRDFTIPVHY